MNGVSLLGCQLLPAPPSEGETELEGEIEVGFSINIEAKISQCCQKLCLFAILSFRCPYFSIKYQLRNIMKI